MLCSTPELTALSHCWKALDYAIVFFDSLIAKRVNQAAMRRKIYADFLSVTGQSTKNHIYNSWLVPR